MDSSSSILIVIIVILIIISSFVSACETAITACSFIKIKSMADGGDEKAKSVLFFQERKQKIITSMLIVNNIVNLSASTLTTVVVIRLFSEKSVALFTFLLTIIILIFGEIVPKHRTSIIPESFIIKNRSIIIFLYSITKPIVYVLDAISKLVLKFYNIDMDYKDDSFTEDELKTIVDISHEEGVIETEEKTIIQNVFDFTDTKVGEIIIPRTEIVFIDINSTYEDILKIFKTERYTRIPIYDEQKENIIGILNIKDFLLREIDEDSDLDLKKIMMKPHFCYENMKIADVLTSMRRNVTNMYIVLDEYGSIIGLVTLEDILEELVGDIRDEYDANDEEDIRKIKDRDYLVKGYVSVDDINEKLGIDIKNEEFDSIGGIFISKVKDIPKVGQEVDYDIYHLRIEKMDNNRIDLIRLSY